MTEPSLAAQLMLTGLISAMPAIVILATAQMFLEGKRSGRAFFWTGITLLVAAGLTMIVGALGEIWQLFPY